MRELDVTGLISHADELSAGDEIALSGVVYTSRDAAHKRLCLLIKNNEKLPFELFNSIIYYAGPTPAKPNTPCGSFGPTTSARMDMFAPLLYEKGVFATIGKGERNNEVRQAIIKRRGLYLLAIGGAGALAAHHITSVEETAFSDLGCESVKRVLFDKFPLYVGIDTNGNDIFSK